MAPRIYSTVSLLILLYLVQTCSAINAATCSSFQTSGFASTSFTNHRFYDFRHLPPGSATASSSPWTWTWPWFSPWSSSDQFTSQSQVISTNWLSDWDITSKLRGKHRPGWANVLFSPDALTIESDPSMPFQSYLQLHTTRLSNETQKSAQIIHSNAYPTLSMRVMLRVSGSPGAVAGIFTYHNDTQETDIEILTRDPKTNVHFSNQPADDPGSSHNISLASTLEGENAGDGDSKNDEGAHWGEWHEYRLDWAGGKSAWFVDGISVANSTVNVPSVACPVYLNMWSNGGTWPGHMEEGDEAVMQVRWIELLFNDEDEEDGGNNQGPACGAEEVGIGLKNDDEGESVSMSASAEAEETEEEGSGLKGGASERTNIEFVWAGMVLALSIGVGTMMI